MHHTHVLLRKNFLQGGEEEQQSAKSPSNSPSANDKGCTANNEIDGETWIDFDSMKYTNASHSCIAL